MRACCLWQGRVARGKGMGPNLGLSWAQGVLTPCASLIHHHFTIACGWSQTGALKTMLSWLPSQGSDPPCPAQQPNCPAQQPRQPNCHGYPAKAVIPPVLRNSLTPPEEMVLQTQGKGAVQSGARLPTPQTQMGCRLMASAYHCFGRRLRSLRCVCVCVRVRVRARV